MWRAKLGLLRISLKTGRVTLPYPAAPHPPAEGFRGLPELDGTQCVGCGACVNACPARLIGLYDREGRRVLTANLHRCTYCGRCAEVCPTGAMRMSTQFETVTADPAQLHLRADLQLAGCTACGRPLGTTRQMVQYMAELGLDPGTAALCTRCKRRGMAGRLREVYRRG
ncbi:MAG: 4Fe-4S dicluster domain-containing protein [Mycobacterium leprae]